MTVTSGKTEPHVVESERRVPVVRDVDVVVAGAGCAGVFAALAAAQYGAKTLLIDRFGSLGGNVGPGMIYGCVDPLAESAQLAGGLQGLVKQFADRAAALRGQLPSVRPVYSNIFSYLAAKMMEEFGVELMLSAYGSDPIMENGVVRGLFVETKSGRVAVQAKVVIDDTAEADIARRAGAPIIRHVKPDPDFSPVIKQRYRQEMYENWNEVGLVFLVAGVDWAKYDAFTQDSEAVIAKGFPPIEPNGIIDNQRFDVVPILKYPSKLIPCLRAAWDKGEYRFAREVAPKAGLFWQANMDDPAKGFVRIGQDGAEGTVIVYGDIDTDDWKHVSICEAELRKHAFDTIEFMRRSAPGWEQAFVVFTNPFAGARGGACIAGEYVVTPDDILKGARRDDVILRSQWEAKTQKLGENKRATPLTSEGYDLPYRMMLPKGLDNLLVVGRGSSYLRRGHDPSTRGRVTQFHLGQVAGTAAAFCVKDGLTAHQCNVKNLQRELLSQGFYLGDEKRLKELGLR